MIDSLQKTPSSRLPRLDPSTLAAGCYEFRTNSGHTQFRSYNNPSKIVQASPPDFLQEPKVVSDKRRFSADFTSGRVGGGRRQTAPFTDTQQSGRTNASNRVETATPTRRRLSAR